MVVITFGRRITDIKTDVAYQKLVKSTEFMLKMNVPGAQCAGSYNNLYRRI